ncbi:MAG: FlgD immunoglobulin-like domain containing protein [Treponema sp.]|nr:FlgD immunoglobulin-like domain containing protein [Treponema sp.]
MKNPSVFFKCFYRFLRFFLIFVNFFYVGEIGFATDFRWASYDSEGWSGNWSDVDSGKTKHWEYYSEISTGLLGWYKCDGYFPGYGSVTDPDVYFTAENESYATLTADCTNELKNLFISDRKNSNEAFGSAKVTINLDNHTLKTENLVLGNSSLVIGTSVNLALTGGGTLMVSGLMTFVAGCTYNIEIGAGTVLNVSALSVNSSGAKINFSGAGTLNLGTATFSDCTVNFELEKIEISEATDISDSATVSFNNVSNVIFAEELKNSGNLSFSDCPDVKFTGGFNNSGKTEFSGATASSVSGEITNSGTLELLYSEKITFSGRFENQTTGILLCNETAATTFSGDFGKSGKVTINGSATRTFATFENNQNGIVSVNGTSNIVFDEFINDGTSKFSVNDSAKINFQSDFTNSTGGIVELFGDGSSSISFPANFDNYGTIYSRGLCTINFSEDVTDFGTWIYSGGTVKNVGITYNILRLTGIVVISGDLTATKIEVETEKLNIQGKINADSIEINTENPIFLDVDVTLNSDVIELSKNTVFETCGKNLTFGSENDGSSIISNDSKNLEILNSASTGKIFFYSSIGTATSTLRKISSEAELSFNADVYAVSLVAKAAVEIHSEKIVTSAGQEYSSSVAVSGTEKTEINAGGTITFGKTATFESETSIYADGAVTFYEVLKTSANVLLSVEGSETTFSGAVETLSEFKVSAKSGSVNFKSTADFSGKTSANAANGDVIFGSAVTASDDISVTASKAIFSSDLTLSAGSVSLLADTIFSGNSIVSLKNGTFSIGDESNQNTTTVNNSATVSFNNVSNVIFAEELKNLGSLSFSGCPDVEFTGGFNNGGKTEFSGATASSVSGKITNFGTLELLYSEKTTFSGGFENQVTGILLCNETAGTTFSGGFGNSGKVTISGSATRTFATFEKKQNGIVSVNDSVDIDFQTDFTNSAGGTVELFGDGSSSISFPKSFKNTGTIYSRGLYTINFSEDVTDSGTWIYSGGTVKNVGITYNILELNGTILIPRDLTATKIIIETESLKIQGKINSNSIEINTEKSIVLNKDENTSITAKSVKFLQNTTFDVNGKNLVFNKKDETSAISGGGKNLVILDSGSGGKATFYSSIGTATSPLGKISSEAEISFNADIYVDSIEAKNAAQISSAKITTTNGQVYNSAVSVTGTSPVSLAATTVQFDSDFVVSGEVSILAETYFSGVAKDEIKIEAEKIVVGAENLEKNLYISALKDENSAKKVEWNAPLNVYGNLLLLNGNLSFGKNPSGASPDISVSKDIVFLNGDSSSMYNDDISAKFEWRSGAKNIFKYRGTAKFPENFPDGTEISAEKFYSSLDGLGGITISAGNNFYCNGISLEGDSEWNLKAGDNENSENFAVAYNSSIKNCSYSSSGSGISYFAAAEATDNGGNNENVCFGHPEISFARTVYDDVVEISFKDSVSGELVKIENSKNEIWETFAGSSKFLTYENNSEKISFAGTYVDAECTETTENQGDIEKFYLKAPETWNTDATGKSSGAAQSTDMNGNHRGAIPYLNLVRAISDDFSGLLDEHKNRVANYDGEENRFVDVTDSCSPVLIAVRTGQELHEELPENQATYDSHNFLEFQYSEEIFADKNDSSALNVQSSEKFGGMENLSSVSGFVVSGLVQFEKGKISLGAESGLSAEKLNSLYRNFAVSSSKGASPQTHRFRISLAGYQSQPASENSSGFPYWPGYIDSENTEIPAGKIVQLSTGGENSENDSDANFNDFIKDSKGNRLLVKSQKNHELQTLSVISNSSEDSFESDWSDSLYGSWDLSAPVFAAYHPLRSEKVSSFYEILGACKTSGTVLERVEFHVFDNSDDFYENLGAEWYSHFGWGKNKSTLFSEDSYGSDIFGGSRPFGMYDGEAATKTSGGIRYSTLYNKSSYFKYGIDSESPAENFEDSTIKSGASSSLFLPQVGSKREISSNDSLYFSIFLKSGTNLPLKTNFSISYDEKACVTDLAGNLMKSAQVKSVDRVSPRFNMTSAKISGNKIYIVFNKKIQLEPVELESADGTVQSFGIADSLRFIKIPENGHKFDESDIVSDLYVEKGIAPQETYSSETFTGLIFTLNRNVTLEDVKNYYIQCFSPGDGKFVDPFTGINDVKVTSITDINGIYMEHGEAHALSDFAVNVVNPVYAYDDRFLDENFGFSVSDAKESNLAVHDWNKEQQNDGTLITEHDIFVVTSQDSGNSGVADTLPEKIIMYYDNAPDSDSVSSEYNKNLEKNLRVWIPSFVPSGDDSNSSVENVSPISALAPSTNSKNLFVAGEIDKSIAKFVLDWETLNKNGYSSGNQISFLFGLADSDGLPVKICHAPSYDEISGSYKLEKQPLFALRLKNAEDATSLDLWSFKLKNVTLQRGNVTIFNNVIDANQGEMSVVQVNMPSEGNLDVIVMTLDGNIIRYLQHGTASAGEHNYSWNGTTKSGKKVARGLYFVRVFGNGIDETRKIMVVKN